MCLHLHFVNDVAWGIVETICCLSSLARSRFFFFFFQNLQIFKKVARFCQMPCWPSKTHVQSAWGNTSDHGNAVRLKSSWQGQNVPEYSGVQTDGTHGCLHRKLETRTKPGEKPNTMNPKGGDLFSLRKGNKFLPKKISLKEVKWLGKFHSTSNYRTTTIIQIF